MLPENFDYKFFGIAAGMGALIGLGQVLDAKEDLSWRIVVGRALVSAGLASASPILLVVFPTLSRPAQFAFAAAFASLGTSGLQALMKYYASRKG